MSSSLFLHNFFFLLSGFVNICIAVFVMVYGRKHITSTLTTFSLFCIAVAVFQISQALGADASSATESRSIFMLNLTDIFIGIFWTHWFLGFIGKIKEQKYALSAVYISGLAIFVSCLLFPRLFLVDSVPKLYFPFYYEPGPLYYVMFFWFFIVAAYYFYQMYRAYTTEHDPVEKKRFKYTFFIMLFAFVTGTTAFALVFDIPINPIISGIGGFYTIPLAYFIVKYEFFDIRILAKRAFTYAAIMVFIGIVIIVMNFVESYLIATVSYFPRWLFTYTTALLVGGGGIYIWRKTRENDIAKNEFISVIMHKFRTPLTQAKWATEMLAAERAELSSEGREALGMIEQSHASIIELTNVLVSLNSTDDQLYQYSFRTFDLTAVASKVIDEYRPRFAHKNIALVSTSVQPNLSVYSDAEKIKFVIDILLNNALQYTPKGGKVSIFSDRSGRHSVWKISDNGIGIPDQSSSLIFSKFYRGQNAKTTNTEGTGIGLYLAHEMVRRAGGTLSFLSEGEGKGSTFIMNLPSRI